MTIDLYNEDCIIGMRSLKNGSVDVIITSPPYNIGIGYNSYKDDLPKVKYIEWLTVWANEAKRVLSNKGSLFLNIGIKPSDPSAPFDVATSLKEIFCLQNVIHWVKSISIEKEDMSVNANIGKSFSVGHYKPVNSQRYLNNTHEYIFHFTKNGDVLLDRTAIGVEYQDKTNVNRWRTSGAGVRCRGNVWVVPYKTINNKKLHRPHPATFPVKLPTMCIKLHGLENTKLVMDPFMGIGHTALACKKLGVDFIGYEIDKDYYLEVRKHFAER